MNINNNTLGLVARKLRQYSESHSRSALTGAPFEDHAFAISCCGVAAQVLELVLEANKHRDEFDAQNLAIPTTTEPAP